ncbi:outer membrane lipoprotein carrier protein LolA [Gallaecimonas sp. GXIMD4217]|uniref:LolA family protein n=1 Tax=Gallaecimonas sp. GXIMD4217 TaxID=3131927 RepID=UPI00311AE334
MNRLWALLALVACQCLALPGWQQPGEGQALTGRFEQQKQLPALSRPLQSQGRFSYRDDALTWDTETPFASTLVMSREALIQRLPGLAETRLEVTDNPVAAAMAAMFSALFSGDRERLAKQFQVTEEALEQGWRLTLLPTDPQLTPLLDKVVLSGDQWPQELEIAEKGQRLTRIRFSELRLEARP